MKCERQRRNLTTIHTMHAVSKQHNENAEMATTTTKQQRNNVRINGQNREDAYSSIVRQRKQIETREKAFRIARANWIRCQQKDRKKKLPWGFYYYFVVCFGAAAADYTVWYGRWDRLSIRIAFYICAWLKEEQNERANTRAKTRWKKLPARSLIVSIESDRAARTGSHNEIRCKWREFMACDGMRENGHDQREYVCRR